jgi:hypothetical protein
MSWSEPGHGEMRSSSAAKSAGSPSLRQILADFQFKQGRVAMPDAALNRHLKTHRALPLKEQKLRAQELMAAAMIYQRAGTAAQQAVAQLCWMAADLLVSKKSQAFSL